MGPSSPDLQAALVREKQLDMLRVAERARLANTVSGRGAVPVRLAGALRGAADRLDPQAQAPEPLKGAVA